MPPKTEDKPSGIRGLFSKRMKPSPPPERPSSIASAPDAARQPGDAVPSGRRTYTARYAQRDMILSMPVEQRPDLVARAKEGKLQRACSDIGFSAASSSSASFGAIGSSESHIHPVLQERRQIATQAPVASSSYGRPISMRSGRGSMSPRSISMPVVPLKGENYWRGMPNGFTSVASKSYASSSVTSQPDDAQIERVDYALRKVDMHGFDRHDTQRYTRSDGHATNESHQVATASLPRPAKMYFSHNQTMPNLRSNVNKGKAKATDYVSPSLPSIAGSPPDRPTFLPPVGAGSQLSPPSVTDSDCSQHTQDAWSRGQTRIASVYTTFTSATSEAETDQAEEHDTGEEEQRADKRGARERGG